MWDKLSKLLASKTEYDQASQDLLTTIHASAKNLEAIAEMKKTEGWQILEERIRIDIHDRILEKVKDDIHIQSLLNILVVSSTTRPLAQLEEEIDKLIPE